MRKKEIFFAGLFLVCFTLCGILLAANTLVKKMDHHRDNDPEIVQAKEDPKEDNGSLKEEEPLQTAEEPEKKPEKEPEKEPEEMPEKEPEEVVQATYDEFFQDTLFVGDSRTVGLMEYADIQGADFFADTGMTVFSLEKKKLSVSGEGKETFEEVLKRKQYGKIYFMLGINELGDTIENIQNQYSKVVDTIQTLQPDAVIYLCANLHVTANQSAKDKMFNNDKINQINQKISEMADNKQTFFLDVNEVFDDANGNLSTEYSFDAFHVYGRYYRTWAEWLYHREASNLG